MRAKIKTNRVLRNGMTTSARQTPASLIREINDGVKFFWASRGGQPHGPLGRPRKDATS